MRRNKQRWGCVEVNLGPFEGVEVDRTKFPFVIARISIQKMWHLNRRKASKDTQPKSIPEGKNGAYKRKEVWNAIVCQENNKRFSVSVAWSDRRVAGRMSCWAGRGQSAGNLHSVAKRCETDPWVTEARENHEPPYPGGALQSWAVCRCWVGISLWEVDQSGKRRHVGS